MIFHNKIGANGMLWLWFGFLKVGSSFENRWAISKLDFVIMQGAVWVRFGDDIIVKEWVKKLFSGAAT